MEVLCKQVRIEGRVQGVSYRIWTQKQAEHLGIVGSAINCPDGSVLVTACGQSEGLASLIQLLKEGPPEAHVKRVHIEGNDNLSPMPSGFHIG
ncbi:MAG: acylphosphatase [Kistimonas sp.]|nr:acylphosphatase [Kistimonas sp.]